MRAVLVALLCCCVAQASAAVGFTTLPERDTVRMTIYNAVDLTLVQESRSLVLKKGLNRIQYQWSGTLIDATSLELRPLQRQKEIEIMGLVYPPNAPATLVWEVESQVEGAVPFEISYFTSGLTWSADYVLRADPAETKAEVEGWVAVGNQSGEDYPKTEVRLVVGSINLVESIRDLATGQMQERRRGVRKDELMKARRVMAREAAAAPAAMGTMEAEGMALAAPEVVSARLADYHIFSIGGVQAVKQGATTRFKAITTREPMPLEVLYRVDLGVEQAVKLYRFINDEAHQLPKGPLPEGQWHVFRVTDAATRSLSYSGSTHAAYVPPEQKVELNLGVDPGIAVKQVLEWHAENEHHFDQQGRVDGWINHDRWRFKLVNTKAIPVSLEYLIRVDSDSDWAVNGLTGERRDKLSFRHQDKADPGKALELGPFTISQRQGAWDPQRGATTLANPPTPSALPAISSK